MKLLLLLLLLPLCTLAQGWDTTGWVKIRSISFNHSDDEWVRKGSPADERYQASLPRVIVHDTIYKRDTIVWCNYCHKYKDKKHIDSVENNQNGLMVDTASFGFSGVGISYSRLADSSNIIRTTEYTRHSKSTKTKTVKRRTYTSCSQDGIHWITLPVSDSATVHFYKYIKP